MAISNHDYFKTAIQDLLPPGGLSSDPSSTIGNLCSSLAKLLEQAQMSADQLLLEVFPHTAQECLDEWAKVYDHVHPSNAEQDDKQNALISRWRSATYPSLFGVRQALAPILNSLVAFRDTCDDSNVSVRYNSINTNGSTDEDGTRLRIEGPALADVRWDGVAQIPEALLIPIVDTNDGYQVQAQIDAYSLASDCRCGVMAFESPTSAVWFGIEDVTGTARLRWGSIEDGMIIGPFEAVAVPATPFWIQLRHENGEYSFSYGASLGALTTAATTISSTTVKPRQMGWFAANDATGLAQMDLEEVQIQYDLPHNNVEIIERLTSWGGEDEDVFKIFVHREPTGGGTYDIAEAQRQADRMIPAHNVVLVGESDVFRADDPYSLLERDFLGS